MPIRAAGTPGVSHHSLTAYGRVALAPADVVVPDLAGHVEDGLAEQVQQESLPLGAPQGRHRLVPVACDGLLEALRGCPVGLSTMGRGLDDDASPFLAAAAAGRHAVSLCGGSAAR